MPHNCCKWHDLHNTLAEGRVLSMEQEPLQHDPQGEVVAAPTEIYSEALQ